MFVRRSNCKHAWRKIGKGLKKNSIFKLEVLILVLSVQLLEQSSLREVPNTLYKSSFFNVTNKYEVRKRCKAGSKTFI